MVQRASQGDQDAFDKLFEAYIDLIYNYFFSRVGSKSVAEGLTSLTLKEATWALVQGRYSLRDRPFKLWLYETASSILLEDNHEMPNTLPHEEQDRLWELIRKFPADEQQIVGMRLLDHLSFAEIALLLSRSEEDCSGLYNRALVRLKQQAKKRGTLK